jgi:hypothetical protein
MGGFAGETGRDRVCSGWINAAERENSPKEALIYSIENSPTIVGAISATLMWYLRSKTSKYIR